MHVQTHSSVPVASLRTTVPQDTTLPEKIHDILRQASAEPDLINKRIFYNMAYSDIRKEALKGELSPELNKELHTLFETYAAATCYNQVSPTPKDSAKPIKDGGESVDEDEGFRKTVALMELSLLMQLDSLGLSDSPAPIDWKASEDLESLARDVGFIAYPEVGFETSNSQLFDKVMQLQIDPTVLAHKAQDQHCRDILSKTLIRLTFAQQNVPHVRTDKKLIEIHQRFNSLTEEVSGEDTIEQHRQTADYKYNRLGFMIELMKLSGKSFPEGVSEEEFLFNSYQKMKEEFEKGGEDYFLLGKRAQCANMQGLILKNNPSKAEKLFNEALAIRTSLLKRDEADLDFLSTGIKSKQHSDNEFLMANVRTGVVHCLVTVMPITEERRLILQEQKEALQQYLGSLSETSNYNGYRPSYENAIKKANSVLL